MKVKSLLKSKLWRLIFVNVTHILTFLERGHLSWRIFFIRLACGTFSEFPLMEGVQHTVNVPSLGLRARAWKWPSKPQGASWWAAFFSGLLLYSEEIAVSGVSLQPRENVCFCHFVVPLLTAPLLTEQVLFSYLTPPTLLHKICLVKLSFLPLHQPWRTNPNILKSLQKKMHLPKIYKQWTLCWRFCKTAKEEGL